MQFQKGQTLVYHADGYDDLVIVDEVLDDSVLAVRFAGDDVVWAASPARLSAVQPGPHPRSGA
jgi:hypothetical protein